MNKSRFLCLTQRGGLTAIAVSSSWLALFLFDPANMSFLPPCPFHLLTGLHCPGCGATRALHQLAHGNLASAVGLNALAVLGLLWWVVLATSCKRVALTDRSLLFLIAAVGLFAIVRNIPIFPFTLLAPW